jgi:glycosyltransferase involved in cell wall biosynthesis
MDPALQDQDILLLSCDDWGAYGSTSEKVAKVLAAKNRVIVIDLPFSPFSRLTGIRKGAGAKLRRWVKGVRPLPQPGLQIVSPPPVLPFRYHGLTNSINQAILVRYIKYQCSRLGIKKPVLLTFQADSGNLVERIDASVKVYYCVENWAAFRRWWQPPELVNKREQHLAGLCDLIFTTSRRLLDKFTSCGKPLYFFPNGVDYKFYSQAPRLTPPQGVAPLRKPVIGFIGSITEDNFDAPLLCEIARRNPDWSFLFIGGKVGRKPDISLLESLPNTFFPGIKPRESLPGYLSLMDVCVIPRVDTELTRCAFPLKLMEYLAAGKPVVATGTEELQPYENLIYLADTPGDFEALITRALNENDADLITKRMDLARSFDWTTGTGRLSRVIMEFLHGKEEVLGKEKAS